MAVILDGFSRRVAGWALADHLRAELALSALEMALARRDVTPGALVHHSDRGVQYACGDYIERLEKAGIQPSMSRPGCPWDNAMAESFMKTLKKEEVDGRAYRDQAEVEASIGTFIEAVYNRQRLHSALTCLPPEAFEAGQTPEPPPYAAAAPGLEIIDNDVCQLSVSHKGVRSRGVALCPCVSVLKPGSFPAARRGRRRAMAAPPLRIFARTGHRSDREKDGSVPISGESGLMPTGGESDVPLS